MILKSSYLIMQVVNDRAELVQAFLGEVGQDQLSLLSEVKEHVKNVDVFEEEAIGKESEIVGPRFLGRRAEPRVSKTIASSFLI